jgi:Alpha 1,4-glycosyltransferase conserved region
VTLARLNSLWVGDDIGDVGRLCVSSARQLGHPFTLYSYTPRLLRDLPSGVEVRDAREVMPECKLVRYSGTDAVQLGANFFRYELQAQKLGYWVDMDFYFVKPLDFASDYVFGWEYEGWINNALLRVPADSMMAQDLCALPGTNRRPPWFGPRRSLAYYWKRLTKGRVRVQDLPWGTYSSGMTTYLAKKYGVAELAQKPTVFYPVRWRDAHALFGPAEGVEAMITEDTRAVHLWYSRLEKQLASPISKESYLAKIFRRHGIDAQMQ